MFCALMLPRPLAISPALKTFVLGTADFSFSVTPCGYSAAPVSTGSEYISKSLTTSVPPFFRYCSQRAASTFSKATSTSASPSGTTGEATFEP